MKIDSGSPTGGGANAAPAPELGVFVIWGDGRAEQDRILAAIAEGFEIRSVTEVVWTEHLISENFARFYRNYPLPPYGNFLETQKGRGPFLVVAAIDPAPRYEPRMTTSGMATVSASFLEAKQRFRTWSGGNRWLIHAADSAAHAARDLALLLGTDPEAHLRVHPAPWDGTVRTVHRDVTGAHGWESFDQLFHTLNATVPYLVLRNFDEWPDPSSLGAHDDVDLLTSDYLELIRVAKARPLLRRIPRWGGRFWVRVAGRDVLFDLRLIGDRYYDPAWARALLAGRVRHERGFYTPGETDYFESLAYHAIVHKHTLSTEYKDRLARMAEALGRPEWDRASLDDPATARRLLLDLLQQRGYALVRPRDPTVFFNFRAAGSGWPEVRRQLARVRRHAARLASPFIVHPLERAVRTARSRLGRGLPGLRRLYYHAIRAMWRRSSPQRA